MRRSAFLALLVVLGLAYDARAQWPLTSCTPLGMNLFVRDVLTDLYLWHADMQAANPAGYGSPERYLEAIRYRRLDSTFSFVASASAVEAFFSESAFVGFGMSTSVAGLELRVLQVFPGSPAADAGISRGDRIVAIDGVDVAQLVAQGRVDAAFGAAMEGVGAEIVYLDGEGTRRMARLVKRLVTIPTVSHTRVFEAGGRRVGYLFFRNFVQPSYAALDEAFAELARGGVDDLVLDLRYNGGGLVGVAQHLAGLIGGARTAGHKFAQYAHNDRNAYRNAILRFPRPPPGALDLQRLIVIATRASASASELVINALAPFMPVVIVGDRTFGKPVGQYQIRFCDRILAPVAFSLRNARGHADFFEGFAPTCAAPDDASHQLGDPAEASLREALAFAATGACSSGRDRVERLAATARSTTHAGWQAVVNAY